MISKQFKVEKNQINYILKKGESSTSNLFIIRYAKGNQDFCRYCVIVSKKLNPSAVKRNRLKRQIYEAIRTSEQKNQNHLDIVLIPKKQILKKSFEEIKEGIEEIINKYG